MSEIKYRKDGKIEATSLKDVPCNGWLCPNPTKYKMASWPNTGDSGYTAEEIAIGVEWRKQYTAHRNNGTGTTQTNANNAIIEQLRNELLALLPSHPEVARSLALIPPKKGSIVELVFGMSTSDTTIVLSKEEVMKRIDAQMTACGIVSTDKGYMLVGTKKS